MEKLERLSQAATFSKHDRVVSADASLIHRKSEYAAVNPRAREVHFFHGGPTEPLQRMLNALQPDSYVRPHRHVQSGKAECVVLLSGSLAFVTFFDDGRMNVKESVHLQPGKAL